MVAHSIKCASDHGINLLRNHEISGMQYLTGFFLATMYSGEDSSPELSKPE